MKLSTQLRLLIGIAMIGVFSLGASSLWTLRHSMRDQRKTEILDMLYAARGLVGFYAEQEQKGLLTQSQAQRGSSAQGRVRKARKTRQYLSEASRVAGCGTAAIG
jgi:methyl-accepting chemotaxis protein